MSSFRIWSGPMEPPDRSIERVQRILQEDDSATLLGGAQAIVDGGKLASSTVPGYRFVAAVLGPLARQHVRRCGRPVLFFRRRSIGMLPSYRNLIRPTGPAISRNPSGRLS